MPMDGSNFTGFFNVVNTQVGGTLGWAILIVSFIILFSITKTANTNAKSAVVASFITSILCLMLSVAGITDMFELIACGTVLGVSFVWSYFESSSSAF